MDNHIYEITTGCFCWAGSFCCDCFGCASSHSRRREGCKRASEKECGRSNRVERRQTAVQYGQDGWKGPLYFAGSADGCLQGHVGSKRRGQGVHHEYDDQSESANATEL